MGSIEEESQPSFKKKKIEPEQGWSDRPRDFVRLILGKLPWSERLRVSLVCKTWKECFHEIQNTQEFLPWLMSYRWHATDDGRVDSICKLADPFEQKCYTVEEATKGADQRGIFVGAEPCASSHGWVLLSKATSGVKHLFLYSPFTDEVIRFPELVTGFKDKASFSLNPTSSDCVVIALSIQEHEKLEIKTCHPGDESWKSFEFSGEYYFICDVGYADGSFYVTFSNGKLGAFNIKQQEWKLLWDLRSEPSPNSPPPVHEDTYIYLVAAFNGDIILSCCRSVCLPCASYRFDLSKGKRVIVEREAMEKQVIFRGCTSFSAFSVPAEGNARESAGKINYFYYNTNTPWSIYCNCIDSRRYQRPCKGYEWMEKDDLRRIWIQPPFQRIMRASDLLQSGSKPNSEDKSS
ncbi:hypothetical protein ACOSP7_015007 [Xanthoceras sorbifolium]|uniref:F-box domain-containing protein n=1 Tax=Xanthoceras sorbifolium TaxID=99658 RepID=A0ABQ8I6Q3_9ROSI|nr:hypothetical protein JRO89_XS04G0187000 [Xanthoceras sorbifolium]